MMMTMMKNQYYTIDIVVLSLSNEYDVVQTGQIQFKRMGTH